MARNIHLSTPLPVIREAHDEKGFTFVNGSSRTAANISAVPLAGPRMRPRKKKSSKKLSKRKSKKGRVIRSPLKDVSAETISLKDAADFIGTIWTYGKYALGALNAELKENYILNSNGTVVNDSFFYVSGLAQGVDYDQRIGDSIKVENVRFEYVLSVNPTAGENFTRIIIFRDFMNQGVLPTAAELLQDTSTVPLQITSPYLHTNADRFEVMYDVVHCQTTSSDSALIHRRVAVGLNDHIVYSGTDAMVASAWQGALFCAVITDQPTNGPKLQLSSLMTYVDD